MLWRRGGSGSRASVRYVLIGRFLSAGRAAGKASRLARPTTLAGRGAIFADSFLPTLTKQTTRSAPNSIWHPRAAHSNDAIRVGAPLDSIQSKANRIDHELRLGALGRLKTKWSLAPRRRRRQRRRQAPSVMRFGEKDD